MTLSRFFRRRWLAFAFVPLAAAAGLFLAPDEGEAQGGSAEPHAADFSLCRGSVRVTCVVDGDTIWYRGIKIRIADIDTPEVTRPACPEERARGEAATERLRELLNAGRFGMAVPPDGRRQDRYGRELRILTRGGTSLGEVLVREGLAARWGGAKARWCRV